MSFVKMKQNELVHDLIYKKNVLTTRKKLNLIKINMLHL